MKIQRVFLSFLSILAAPFLSVAQQAPPLIQARPLYGSAALSVSAPMAPSNDSRVIEVAARLKEVAAQVRDANPAAVPVLPGKKGSTPQLARAAGRVDIRMRHGNGTPRYIEGTRLHPAASAAAGTNSSADIDTARNFLRANKELLRLRDPDSELALAKSERDDLDRRHLRFEQRHKGLRVYPGEVGIHLNPAGDVYLMTGAYVPTPDMALTKPTITPDDATARARIRVVSPVETTATEPELIVYAPGERTPRLAWKLELISDSARWLVVIDATDGRVLNAFDQVAAETVSGSGVDLMGQVRPLHVWHEGNSFFLVDTSKKMFDATSDPPSPTTTRGGIVVVDARNQPPTDTPQEIPTVFDVVSPTATGFTIRDTVSAAFNIPIAYDYYLARHKRNSYDGNGSTILVISRLGVNWYNATFSPQGGLMRIGDADTFAASLDVMAHEFTHGVTGSTANLEYQNQSGAMNEAFSDIFGEMAEFFHFGSNDWLVGTSTHNPLRSMKDPNSKNQPAKMSEYQNLPPNQDAGGVHVNSGIINKAYYLLTEGLQGGIGRPDAEKIFYRALTVYLMKNSNFIDGRLAAVRAAKDLFGDASVQAQRTAAAFDAVEIFDNQPTPPPPDTPPVSAADSTLFLYGDQNTGFALARREAARNDPAEGSLLGMNFASPRPPAVNGAGDLAVYVTADNDISLVRTDGASENKLGFPGLVHSVGMSPDGSHFGFVLQSNGQPDNYISVIDVVTPNAQPKTYELRAPANDGGSITTIAYADALAFTANRRFLIYDALNAIHAPDGTELDIYSIYGLDLGTGNIFSLVPPIPRYSIGNPSISKTNDNFMAFEGIDLQTGVSTILTADLNSGKVTNVGSAATIGYPCYTGADDGIVYAESNPNTATGLSLVRQALGTDRQTASGQRTVWLLDGGYPFIYRRGAFQGPPKQSPITRLANISTRMRVLEAEKVLIGGFIITGTGAKKVIIRGIGPSLKGVGATLADPILELHQGNTVLATNDNWKTKPDGSSQQAEVEATTIPPSNDLESAIVVTLNPGTYTAVLAGKNNGTGVGLVEVYDLSQTTNSKLANISTRGFVDTADNVMIGGLIVTPGADAGTAKVIVRGIGPSLGTSGVKGTLQDPTLEVHNGNGVITASNDNWKRRPDGSSQQAEIEATTVPPKDDRESAIVETFVPGNYTAIVSGKNKTTGVGLVEVYHLQ